MVHPNCCRGVPNAWQSTDRLLSVRTHFVRPRYATDGLVGNLEVNPELRGQRYLAALYFTMTTMTTVGYGDILPQSTAEVGAGYHLT